MKGSISLIDFDGTLIYFAQYDDFPGRKKIIERWRNMVGKKMDRMSIQIAPDYRPSEKKPRN